MTHVQPVLERGKISSARLTILHNIQRGYTHSCATLNDRDLSRELIIRENKQVHQRKAKHITLHKCRTFVLGTKGMLRSVRLRLGREG